MEHRKADVRQVTSFAVSADDAARFLRELRQLRDGAGLGQAELAARAHFPYDSIKAAEIGPALPDLPVLSAYVRGCGGTAEEWEERWRSLTRSPSLPVPASRTAGRSDAATAGARIGSVSQIGDNPDPSIILAALNRVAEEMASPVPDPVPPSFDVQAASDERTLTESSLSSLTEALTSADESMSTDKPSGWDPIRVSTAWPVLPDMPTVADEPASDKGAGASAAIDETTLWKAANAAAAPWETAAWEKHRSDFSATSTADSAAPAAGAPAAGVTATAGATAATETAATAKAAPDVARVPAAAATTVTAAGVDGDAGRASSSRTRVLVTAAVLLCVLAVLLAVFA